ncbi:hypothetical protein A2U01_0057210, partial [Trifolium medium]|nr:hypothetical protein [Trifolium medium]
MNSRSTPHRGDTLQSYSTPLSKLPS